MIKLVLLSLVCTLADLSLLPDRYPQSFESLLCREWKLNFTEEGGRKILPQDGEENGRFIFYNNATAEFIEAEEHQEGLWEYDPSTNVLVFMDRVTKEKMTMKVTRLTRTELVIILTDEENSIVHLVPVK